jgi:cytoskeletal protein CcmA (bactofilin family)
LNVTTGATINAITANTTNTVNLEARTVNITGNVTSDLKLTNDLYVGDALKVYGSTEIDGNTLISGNLTVSGNITLDTLGFDDLIVNGSGSFSNTLSVTGITTLSNVIVTGNVATLNITSNTVTQNLRVDGTSNFTGNATFVHANTTGTLTVNQLGGTANTAIYSELARISGDSLAFSIALG